MSISIVAFGSLSEIIGESLQLENVADTNSLIAELNKRYPDLQHSKYMVAVNKKMINANTPLNANDTVALMSPFSGG